MSKKAIARGFALAILLAVHFGVYSTIASGQQTPISSCGPITASGSYQLVNNLTTSGDCLVVAAGATANITIDLNGFTILGDGTGSGIRGDNVFEGFTIRNGTVKNFNVGLSMFGNTGLVEKVQLIRNTGTALFSVENVILKDSVIVGNQKGVDLGRGSKLIDNIVSDNTGDGIVVLGAPTLPGGGTLVNNTATNNGGVGITVDCPSTLLGNTATGNAGGNLVTNGSGCVNGHGLP